MTLAEYRRKVDDLKRTVSLRSLIESDGHRIVRAGGLDKCCCPFHHEKTPSFCIYPDNHAHCFGCDFHGDVFGYVMKRNGCDFKGAVEKLDGGTAMGYHRPKQKFTVVKKEPELPKNYFKFKMSALACCASSLAIQGLAEKLGVDMLTLFLLGCEWSDMAKAFAFPMHDHTRHVVGIRYRDLESKKWAEKGSKQGLFIPESNPHKDLYVTEGPTDCAAMLSMGLFAIGKASAMQGPEEIVKFIQKHKIRRVIVIADNDTAGLRGAKKLIDVCPVPCCELVLPAKDAREFYRNGGTRELIEMLLKSAVWRHLPHAKLR